MHVCLTPFTIARHRIRRLTLFSVAAVGTACRAAAPAQAHAAVPTGEVRIAQDSPKRAAIGVDTAHESTERVIATLPAQVVPDEGRTVRVTSPVSGRIVALDAQAGDRVTAGQPLARIRSADAAQATADEAKAFAAWTTARAALVRATDLYEHSVIAARDVEQARADEGQAHAELDRAKARARQLGLGRSGVSDAYVLRAPAGGVVIDRTANAGAEVRPDNGQALFTISSLDTVWLVVSVPQHDLARVHRGARLRFTTEALPGRVFDARVNFVSDALDPVSRMATVRAVLENSGGALHLQTTGEAQVLVSDHTSAVSIPARALVTRGLDIVVFVEVSPGRFVRRVVTVSDDDGTTATITAGIAPGDRVVTTGSLLLSAEADRAQ